MTFTPLPDLGSTDWYGWATDLETEVSKVAGKADVGAVLLKWAATTAVTAGELRVTSDGKIIQRNADGTTRSTYDSTEQAAWTVVVGGADTSKLNTDLTNLASQSGARTALGLGTAATQASSAFDPAGSAAAVYNDIDGLPAVSVLNGGGWRLNRWTFPTWGYGGNAADSNSHSPTLLNLDDLGVSKMLWLPGVTGNVISTPDNAGFSGNTGSTPQTVTLQADIVTNEWDPIAGQSNYYLISKPGCWVFRLTEAGLPEVRFTDATSTVTLTGTATVPVKEHIYLQVVFTPNANGVCQADFATSSDGGTTWDQFGDPVPGPRALGAYLTTSGATQGIIVGQLNGPNFNMFRGGLISAQIIMGSTLAGEVRPTSWTTGGTGGTDTAGNVWTINSLQASNWVTQTSLAVGAGEYITLTGSPGGTQLTTAGVYSTLTLSGFAWDLSKPSVLAAYRDSNTIVNLAASPINTPIDLYPDTDGLIADLGGRRTLIARWTA